MNARDKLLREVVWQAARRGHTVTLERTSRRQWLRINGAKVQVYATAIRDTRSDAWSFDREAPLMDDTDYVILVDRREPGGNAPEDTWDHYIVSAEWIRGETEREWTSYMDRQEATTGERERARTPSSNHVAIRLSDRLHPASGAWGRLSDGPSG